MNHHERATRLQHLLSDTGYILRRGHALNCIAALHGVGWHTLSAQPSRPCLPEPQATHHFRSKLAHYGVQLSQAQAQRLSRQLEGQTESGSRAETQHLTDAWAAAWMNQGTPDRTPVNSDTSGELPPYLKRFFSVFAPELAACDTYTEAELRQRELLAARGR